MQEKINIEMDELLCKVLKLQYRSILVIGCKRLQGKLELKPLCISPLILMNLMTLIRISLSLV